MVFYAIKAEVSHPDAEMFVFPAQKTMYGGKHIAAGDKLFVFASENQGGRGLIALGTVTNATSVPKKQGGGRETPRVSISVARLAQAKRPLGRSELKPSERRSARPPEAELHFKLYRQATNKIVALSVQTATFLEKFF